MTVVPVLDRLGIEPLNSGAYAGDWIARRKVRSWNR